MEGAMATSVAAPMSRLDGSGVPRSPCQSHCLRAAERRRRGGGKVEALVAVETPGSGAPHRWKATPDAPLGGEADAHDLPIGMLEEKDAFMLAVPHAPRNAEPPHQQSSARPSDHPLSRPTWICCAVPTSLLPPLFASLPSNVSSVKLELQQDTTPVHSPSPPSVRGPQSPVTPRGIVRVTVVKSTKVPCVGACWPTSLQSQLWRRHQRADARARRPSAPEAHPFLHYSWRGLVSSFIMLTACVMRPDGRRSMNALRSLRPRHWRLVLGAGLGLFLNKAAFAFTSLSHAALFDATAPVWLVGAQLALAALNLRPPVPARDTRGVFLGIVGALTCMLDDTAVGGGGGGGVGGPIHVAADGLALFSGLGACIYLSFAERLRRHVSPLVFYALVLLQLTCYCLVAAYFLDASPPILLSSDPTVGLFGWTWISLPGRLFAQLWLAVVVDLTGNVGLVTVMKYVPALVVAAACLLGPLIARIEGVLLGVERAGVWTLVGGGFTVAGRASLRCRRIARPRCTIWGCTSSAGTMWIRNERSCKYGRAVSHHYGTVHFDGRVSREAL